LQKCRGGNTDLCPGGKHPRAATDAALLLVNTKQAKDKHISRECALKIALTRSIFRPKMY